METLFIYKNSSHPVTTFNQPQNQLLMEMLQAIWDTIQSVFCVCGAWTSHILMVIAYTAENGFSETD